MEEYSEEDKIKIAKMREQIKKSKDQIANGQFTSLRGPEEISQFIKGIGEKARARISKE